MLYMCPMPMAVNLIVLQDPVPRLGLAECDVQAWLKSKQSHSIAKKVTTMCSKHVFCTYFTSQQQQQMQTPI